MKIGFKKKSDIDFKKVFPIIEEAEYSLIEPLTLILTDSEYKKAISNGFIVLGNKQVSSSLIEISSEAQKDHIKEEISKKIQEKNIYFQEVTDAIFLGVELKKNVLLYGRGGHNKSEGTLQILSLMKDNGLITTDPFIISFGDGLTEESLLGGINIKKFKDTGELEYLFKNSFMESEIVIIEEIFDAPPQVLLSLKDILTSDRTLFDDDINKQVYDYYSDKTLIPTLKSKVNSNLKTFSLKNVLNYEIVYPNTLTCVYGSGGIHGVVKPGIYCEDDNHYIIDFDFNYSGVTKLFIINL